MNELSPSPSPAPQEARCWCGNSRLEAFSPDYWRCPECETLVVRAMRGEEISLVRDDEHDFYGKNYYLHHVQEDYGLPDLATRARADLPERCLHWLRTFLKYAPRENARTLELGCGHGGFVAMLRWAGYDAIGLELSPWLVRQARAWFNVLVLEGRLEDQQLAEGSLDAVILMDVLEHLPDPLRTLGRCVSLLANPDSFLLIQTPCYPIGWSYEALCAQNHPFLQQLKPTEHLFLFSEKSVERLCRELNVGNVRFEPAVFAHYDTFFLASAGPLHERTSQEQTDALLTASPHSRAVLALLDLGATRDDLLRQRAALESECAALRAATESQRGEITELHATADRWLREANELWPKLNEALNERNLALAQLADVRGQFEAVQADGAARLEVIERQSAEITTLHADVHRWLEQAKTLGEQQNGKEAERNLLTFQLQDLRGHFDNSEADRAARLKLIEQQGGEIDTLKRELARLGAEARDLGDQLAQSRAHADRAQTEAENLSAALETERRETAELRGTLQRIKKSWPARLLKALRLWPN